MSRMLAQRMYAALPVWAQNLAFSAIGYRERRRRYGGIFEETLAWLREAEWWDRDAIRRYQDEKLRAVIRHAYETVPHYHDVMNERGLEPADIQTVDDLPKLPVLDKETIKRDPRRLLSSAYDRRQCVSCLTSGTTGKALEFLHSVEAYQFQWAVWWRHRARFGLHRGDPYLMFGARQPVPITQRRPPFWRHNRAYNQTYLSTYHLTPEYMPAILDFLNRTPFAFYTGYASAMAVLANFMRERGLRLQRPPKYIVTGAEAVLPNFERLLGEQFGAPVTDQYGATEFCLNMSRCEHNVYHEDFEFGIIETLPNPRDPGGPEFLVGTGLTDDAMPLIRYQVGDLARFADGLCPCGRQTRYAPFIDGRSEDYVVTPDGRMAVGMNQVFEWAPGAREMQIVQHEVERITVRVVKRDSWSQSDERAILHELRSRVGDRLQIDFEFVDDIPRAPSGKFRAVVSTVGRLDADPAATEQQ